MHYYANFWSFCVSKFYTMDPALSEVVHRGHSKSVSLKRSKFLTASSHVILNHHSPWTPSPLVAPQKVTNFELKMSRTSNQISVYIFHEICIFYTQNILYMGNYIKKWIKWCYYNLWNNTNPIVETIFFERMDITLWPRPLPLCHTSLCHLFGHSPPPPKRVRCFLHCPIIVALVWSVVRL